jgi:SpoVK/Ycf46/Vps4 family AAA+-type ATPase
MSDDTIAALRQALTASPDSHPLRLLLAEALREAGMPGEAAEEYHTLLHAGQLPTPNILAATTAALDAKRADLALAFIGAARRAGVVEGLSQLQSRADTLLAEQGVVRMQLAVESAGGLEAAELRDEERVSFADIGGLDEVKKLINRLIILPLARPELFKAYKKQAGGGVLLYGPPGCGKTLLARATAGEVGLPFFNVRIEAILDPYIGVSERNLHDAFTIARANQPCVLFLDEVDALAFSRRKQSGSHGRGLVDQLLQELDAIGAENSGLLILAATNTPWDVDDALLRPGRFDRRIFVPPPDEAARESILRLRLQDLPAAGLDPRRLAKETPLFSGADLAALVERATDQVIEEALLSGGNPPLTMSHFEHASRELRPTTLDWLSRARNYVEFANQDDRYKEVAAFLRSRELRGVRF